MSREKLTNIELTVLGLAWLRGPCSTYAIMRELSLSPSSYHKSRAGTAYSVAKRLISEGYLVKIPDQTGFLLCSDSGAAALREWLLTPVPPEDISHTADLVRLRFYFIGAIEQDQRLEFVDSALVELRLFYVQCEDLVRECERIGDYFGVLAALSTVLETKARITWLETVRKWVEQPMDRGAGWADSVLATIKESS